MWQPLNLGKSAGTNVSQLNNVDCQYNIITLSNVLILQRGPVNPGWQIQSNVSVSRHSTMLEVLQGFESQLITK